MASEEMIQLELRLRTRINERFGELRTLIDRQELRLNAIDDKLDAILAMLQPHSNGEQS